jgi:hypothetical protein
MEPLDNNISNAKRVYKVVVVGEMHTGKTKMIRLYTTHDAETVQSNNRSGFCFGAEG